MAITIRTIFKKTANGFKKTVSGFKKTVSGILDTPFSFKLIFYFCLTLPFFFGLIGSAIVILGMMLGEIDADYLVARLSMSNLHDRELAMFLVFIFFLLPFWSWRKFKEEKAGLKKRN